MAVFRVHKNKNFTIMCNHHLRNKELSAKAKGLLSTMLSLPDEWDYSAEGLARLFSDGLSSIKSGLQELENHKYLIRSQVTAPNGKFAGYDYDIYEFPYDDNPLVEEPLMENPSTENQQQYNTNSSCTYTNNEERLSTENKTYIPKKEKKGLDLSFVNVQYLDMMERYVAYRKERGDKITKSTLERNYRDLIKHSNGDVRIADAIVEQTISRGWTGLFELKQSNQQNNGSSSTTTQQPRATNTFSQIAASIKAAGGIL